MTGPTEGRIEIGLRRRPGCSPEVTVRSSRKLLAQKLFAGQPPERAAHLAGLMFSLCGQAQRTAAELAAAVAGGESAPALGSARAGRILGELAREHAWRLLIDWPRHEGRTELVEPLRRLRQVSDDPAGLAAELDVLLTDALLGEPAEPWLAGVSGRAGLVVFNRWRARGRTVLARLFRGLGECDTGLGRRPLLRAMTALGAAPILDIAAAALADEAFCLTPRLAGGHAETGALGRCHAEPLVRAWSAEYGPGLGARMLARLIELARLPERLAGAGSDLAAAWSPAPGVGVAAVETSRGLLIHALGLADGRIAQYRIVAPTEWNFQPDGPLAAALAAMPDGHDLAARARRLALAMDPCVECRVEVSDA